MEFYNCTFSGKVKGAIDKSEIFNEQVQAASPSDARLALYDKYDSVLFFVYNEEDTPDRSFYLG
ncbi:MAG: hypothetical protein WC441_05200 [Patescibacteria group bacterium]